MTGTKQRQKQGSLKETTRRKEKKGEGERKGGEKPSSSPSPLWPTLQSVLPSQPQ